MMQRNTIEPLMEALGVAVATGIAPSMPALKNMAEVLKGIHADLLKFEGNLLAFAKSDMPPMDAPAYEWLRWLADSFSLHARRDGELYMDKETLCAMSLLLHNMGSRVIVLARQAGYEIPPLLPRGARADTSGSVLSLASARAVRQMTEAAGLERVEPPQHELRAVWRGRVALDGAEYYHPNLDALHGQLVKVGPDTAAEPDGDAVSVYHRDDGHLICRAGFVARRASNSTEGGAA